MKSRQQKQKEIESIVEGLKDKNGFIIVGFNRLKVNDLVSLRRMLKEANGRIRVVRKRLLGIALEKTGVKYDPFAQRDKFLGRVGLVDFSDEIPNVASALFNFEKSKEISILGGFDLKEKKPIGIVYIERIGQLPPREILLGQVLSGMSAPIRALMYILKTKSEA